MTVHLPTTRHLILPVLVAVAVSIPVACDAPGGHQHDHASGAAPVLDGAVPLYDNLGDHMRDVATTSDSAQAYFNQGLRLQYAFNHAEAIRAYEAAVRYDSSCAMCYWGIALASGPNINAPMDSLSGVRAYESSRNARELIDPGYPAEAALIGALALRYDEDPLADRAPLDSAYAAAMAAVAEAYPDDADVLALYAASMMNLNPWNYWSGDYGARVPNPGTEEILASLQQALRLQPDNPGACHYYIHSVEAAYPERAVQCADRLAALMPGAGHIVHMPGHVYIRVGRYADAVRANEHAVHSDETYIADQSPMGIYPAAYYPHNYHFMTFAATMAGMSGKAMEAARIVSPKIPKEIALEVYWIQNAIVLPQLTNLSFGRWERVLDRELPSSDLWLATALAHYARGVAHAALGRGAEAEQEATRLAEVARSADPDGVNDVLNIAKHSLRGEIALRSGDPTDAATAAREFGMAAEIEDAMLYEEPPLWYYPVRHSLGRALLEAGRPAEAEKAYREDLLRFPDNGWSLVGLARALEAQGDEQGARDARVRFDDAWKFADVDLTQSRM